MHELLEGMGDMEERKRKRSRQGDNVREDKCTEKRDKTEREKSMRLSEQ